MSGLAYADISQGGARSGSPQQISYNNNINNNEGNNNSDWVSEERTDAYKPKTKTQVKLDPLQICLFPTYLNLPQDALQKGLGNNLQDLVSQELVQEYGEDFVYFALTDAAIDWYSGESSVCQKSMLNTEFQAGDPCTCALYTGATVMLNANSTNKDILEPQISELVERDLVPNLHNSSDQESFYTELKGASVSWTAAQRASGGKLVYMDNKLGDQLEEEEQLQVVEDISPPEPVVLDESVQDSTVIAVNGVQGSDLQQANAFGKKQGKVLASTVGALLAAMLMIMVFILGRKKRQRKIQEALKDTSTVCDEGDEEIAFSKQRRRKKKRSNSDASSEDEDDESEAAQYRSNSILDCISVGSEWTLATGSVLGAKSTKTMAEMMAAKETFDRDRQITLQKDMLQSEWSGVAPSGLPLSRGASLSKSKNSDPLGGLQFEQATGEGEEIFLMQPAR